MREDGTKADIGFDYSRAQTAARELEREFGLVELETQQSKVSEPGYSRAEYEATARRRAEAKYEAQRHTEQLGWGELSKAVRGEHVAAMKREIQAEGMPRDTLKVEVRAAAAMAETEAEFVGRLYDYGMLVKPFYKDREQTIVGGYQVAMPSKYGEQPWYIAGGSLGHDLSLNRLREQWETRPALRQKAQHAWQQAGRNLAPDKGSEQQMTPEVMQRQAHQMTEHFAHLHTIPLIDRDRWSVEAHHLSGMVASWAKAGGPHAQQLHRAARNLGRSASMKHQPDVSPRKQPWMRGAARVLAQVATGGKGPLAHMVMMQEVLQAVDDIATVHEATKEHRRAQELRLTLHNDLTEVQDAVKQSEGYLSDFERVLADTKPLTSEYLANNPAPIPTAIPESQKTPVEELGRDGLSR